VHAQKGVVGLFLLLVETARGGTLELATEDVTAQIERRTPRDQDSDVGQHDEQTPSNQFRKNRQRTSTLRYTGRGVFLSFIITRCVAVESAIINSNNSGTYSDTPLTLGGGGSG